MPHQLLSHFWFLPQQNFLKIICSHCLQLHSFHFPLSLLQTSFQLYHPKETSPAEISNNFSINKFKSPLGPHLTCQQHPTEFARLSSRRLCVLHLDATLKVFLYLTHCPFSVLFCLNSECGSAQGSVLGPLLFHFYTPPLISSTHMAFILLSICQWPAHLSLQSDVSPERQTQLSDCPQITFIRHMRCWWRSDSWENCPDLEAISTNLPVTLSLLPIKIMKVELREKIVSMDTTAKDNTTTRYPRYFTFTMSNKVDSSP